MTTTTASTHCLMCPGDKRIAVENHLECSPRSRLSQSDACSPELGPRKSAKQTVGSLPSQPTVTVAPPPELADPVLNE